jgi:hypothetical protein
MVAEFRNKTYFLNPTVKWFQNEALRCLKKKSLTPETPESGFQ